MHRFGAALVFVCMLVTGCRSKPLTRQEAASIIQRTLNFPVDVTSRFNLDQEVVVDTTLNALIQHNAPVRWYKALADNKQIDLKWEPQIRSTKVRNRPMVVQVELTDEGKRYVIGPEGRDRASRFVTVKFCERQFDQVTGIIALGGKTARIEYTWKFGNLTPFGEADAEVAGRSSVCGSKEPQPALVMMQLHDDWRIVSQ